MTLDAPGLCSLTISTDHEVARLGIYSSSPDGPVPGVNVGEIGTIWKCPSGLRALDGCRGLCSGATHVASTLRGPESRVLSLLPFCSLERFQGIFSRAALVSSRPSPASLSRKACSRVCAPHSSLRGPGQPVLMARSPSPQPQAVRPEIQKPSLDVVRARAGREPQFCQTHQLWAPLRDSEHVGNSAVGDTWPLCRWWESRGAFLPHACAHTHGAEGHKEAHGGEGTDVPVLVGTASRCTPVSRLTKSGACSSLRVVYVGSSSIICFKNASVVSRAGR